MSRPGEANCGVTSEKDVLEGPPLPGGKGASAHGSQFTCHHPLLLQVIIKHLCSSRS